MEETEITYKDFIIRIVPQGKRGDYSEIFFRIYKGDESNTAFKLWIRTSGTNSRKLSTDQVLEHLKNKGLEQVKRMIDQSEYNKDHDYRITV